MVVVLPSMSSGYYIAVADKVVERLIAAGIPAITLSRHVLARRIAFADLMGIEYVIVNPDTVDFDVVKVKHGKSTREMKVDAMIAKYKEAGHETGAATGAKEQSGS